MNLKKQINLRKGIVLLLICLLVFSAPVSAMAAQVSESASTMRLEKTEGTVAVENSSGKNVSVKNAMRLYSGYEVETKTSSYAWIALDSSKAIKLDTSTDARVQQSGKKLEMQVVSGKMFFNVTKPLESNESMTIRTSTMVTGVRGTSGWVEVIDSSTVRISLLDGTLEVYSINPVTGERRSITITGGQTLTVVYHGENGSGVSDQVSGITTEENAIKSLIQSSIIHKEHIVLNDIGLTVETLQEEDIPGFVAVEIAKDSALQQKIEETTELSVPLIINNADERLKAKEAADEAKSKDLQKQEDFLRAEAVDPLFGTTAENSSSSNAGDSSTGGGITGDDNSGGNNTGGDSTEGGTEEEPPVVEEPDTPAEDDIVKADVTLDNPTTSEVQEALDSNTVVEVTNATITNLNVAANDGLTVPADKTLRLTSGSMQVSDGATLNVEGTLENRSTGDGTNNGIVVQSGGTISVTSTNSLDIYGSLTNNGTINVGGSNIGEDGALTVYENGTLTNNNYISLGNFGSETDGPVTGTLTVQSNGKLINNAGAAVDVSSAQPSYTGNKSAGVLNVAGTLENNVTVMDDGSNDMGEVLVKGEMKLTGILNNNGIIEMGNSDRNANGELSLAGTVTGNGDLTISQGYADVSTDVSGQAISVESNGVLNVEAGGLVTTFNASEHTGYDGTTYNYTNSGTINVNDGGVIKDLAYVFRNSGTLNIESGGAMENCFVINDGDADMNINGGSFIYTGAETGITNYSYGTLNIYTGGNVSISSTGTALENSGTANIHNGTFTGTTYGINNNGGTLEIDPSYNNQTGSIKITGATAIDGGADNSVTITGNPDSVLVSGEYGINSSGAAITIYGGTIKSEGGYAISGDDAEIIGTNDTTTGEKSVKIISSIAISSGNALILGCSWLENVYVEGQVADGGTLIKSDGDIMNITDCTIIATGTGTYSAINNEGTLYVDDATTIESGSIGVTNGVDNETYYNRAYFYLGTNPTKPNSNTVPAISAKGDGIHNFSGPVVIVSGTVISDSGYALYRDLHDTGDNDDYATYTMTGGTLYASTRALLCNDVLPAENGSVGMNNDMTRYCYFVGDTPPEGFKLAAD